MKKIMIVDDDRELLEEITEFLKSSGYDVTQVFRPDLILETAARVLPDVILLDLKLGAASGFNFALQIKGNEETRLIPIIAMTGFYSSKECGEVAKVCNIRDFLIKPVSPEKLIQAIEKVHK